LLLQTVKPNRLIVWIAHADLPKLPEEVRALANFGLEIRACEDLRSYKKLIPALRAFPNAFIVTADDDLYYPPDWLSVLVTGFDAAQPMIISRRAVRVKRARSGSPLPFKEWEQDVQDARARQPNRDLMPETGGGALFPPGCFHPIVEDRK